VSNQFVLEKVVSAAEAPGTTLLTRIFGFHFDFWFSFCLGRLPEIEAAKPLGRYPMFPMNRICFGLICIVGGSFTRADAVAARQVDEATQLDEAAGLAFFEARIRPVLVRECYACHSVQAGQAKGGLQLDTKSGLLVGGDSGPALVPGSPDDSPVWSAINHDDYSMPPGKQLPLAVLEDFEKWIAMGAPDPRTPEAIKVAGTVSDEDIERGRQFWSFVAPVLPPVPKTGDSWAINEIDHFVFDKLQQNNLKPSADASAETVLRRLCYDLVGLPPTPAQIDSFARKWSVDPDKAVAAAVEALLASPRFGERWGRHWLDVARYAESTGKEVNATFPHAWRYRDYVFDSFNADKPYDRFIQEQIAGDLLPVDEDRQWAENIIATGFLAIGPKTLIEQNPRQFAADLIDEQIDASTRVVLGVSVACARCHDHKYDPIPQTDYYAMAGIFRSTRTYYGTQDTRQNRRPSQLIRLPVKDEVPIGEPVRQSDLDAMHQELAEVQTQLEELATRRRQARSNPQGVQQLIREFNTLEARRSALQGLLDSFDENGNPRALCMGVQPAAQPVNAVFLARGEVDQPGAQIPRGFVRVLDDNPPNIAPASSGRLELARWMTRRDNPLAARVMVNRIWQHLIGAAIVPSTDNFGATGEAPSHAELLDWLAVTFMDDGWSVKNMVRRIATSRSYRMASTFDAVAFDKDPENRLVWRANAKRLDAEAIRDTILAVSGKLDTRRPAGSEVARAGETIARDGTLRSANSLLTLKRQAEKAGLGENLSPEEIRDRIRRAARDGKGRSLQMIRQLAAQQPQSDPNVTYRSAYLPVVRDLLPRSLEVFDFAEPSMIIGTRDVSNTPDQGLYFLNNPFVIECSKSLASRVAGEATSTPARIKKVFELCYGRDATDSEFQAAQRFMGGFETGKSDDGQAGLAALCQAVMASAGFRIVD
jgi:hypothetical protein